MVYESKRIIFNVETPSPKSFLVSFPMNMYRIQTHAFEYGFDFFQRAVLMLKANAKVKDEMIAEYLGLDMELIKKVVERLQIKEYIDSNGLLTKQGKIKRDDLDGLTIDPKKTQIGYVLQYIDRNDYYPYYVTNLGEEPNMANRTGIIVGTKGDGQDRVKKPFELSFINEARINLSFPNERELLALISKKSNRDNLSENTSFKKIREDLSIKYLSNEPIPVTVCSYIYLPKRDDDGLFEPDWQILDPFGDEPSSQLKFYLESFNNENLAREIEKRFGDAETLDNKKYIDYQASLISELERTLDQDFSLGFKALDNNLRHYLRSAIKNMLIFKRSNYNDFDSSDTFLINTQNALETIFKLDEQNRTDIYAQMKKDFSNYEFVNGKFVDKGKNNLFYRKRYDNFDMLYLYLHVDDSWRFKKLAKTDPNYANSLKHYLGNLVLTYSYNSEHPMIKLIDGQIDDLICIANKRNPQSHGHTEKEGKIKKLTKEELEKYYSFLKNFINNYMEI